MYSVLGYPLSNVVWAYFRSFLHKKHKISGLETLGIESANFLEPAFR